MKRLKKSPPPFISLIAALLALLTALPASAQTTTECSITPGDVWSAEGNYMIVNNTLAPEEGHNFSFPLTYKCLNLENGERPVISINNPSTHTIDTKDFRGGYSETDGFGDGDEMTGKCLQESGCEIEFFASSKDNNCRNTGATLQSMTISTRITNIGPGPLNLTDRLDIRINVMDDDTLPQRYIDMGYTQWKPTC